MAIINLRDSGIVCQNWKALITMAYRAIPTNKFYNNKGNKMIIPIISLNSFEEGLPGQLITVFLQIKEKAPLTGPASILDGCESSNSLLSCGSAHALRARLIKVLPFSLVQVTLLVFNLG